MADAIATITEETVSVTVHGTELLEPLVDRAETAATNAEASETAATASASAAATDAATADAAATTSTAERVAIEAAIAGYPDGSTLTIPVASRALMAAIASPAGAAYLYESGREGEFVWDSSNLSASVTADPYQGIYVPPSTDTTGATGAWVRRIRNGMGLASWFGTTAHPVDDSARLRSALQQSLLREVWVGAVTLGIGSTVFVPGGKKLRGIDHTVSILKALAWADFTGANNRMVTGGTTAADYTIDGMRVSDLTFDGSKEGMGLGSNFRLTLVCPTGTNFLVERVHAKDGSGYLFYGRGESITTNRAGGTFRDCYGENGDTIFEATYGDGILFENCHGRDGDGDIACEAGLITWAGSDNTTFRDCSFIGTAGVGLSILATERDALGITIENVRIENGTNIACHIDNSGGAYISYVKLSNCRFTGLYGALSANSRVEAVNCTFDGEIGWQAGGNSELLATNCIGRGYKALTPAYGLYIESGDPDLQVWNGGKLAASGAAGSTAYSGGVVSQHTVLDPLVPGHPLFDSGTSVTVTADSGLTVTDINGGNYRLTQTAASGTLSQASTAVGSLPGPFLISVFPVAGSEFFFGITDVAGAAVQADIDSGMHLSDYLRQANGGPVSDGSPRVRPLHIERDADNNIIFTAGGETPREGKVIYTRTAADHAGALSGAFKAAFGMATNGQVLDVRVATR